MSTELTVLGSQVVLGRPLSEFSTRPALLITDSTCATHCLPRLPDSLSNLPTVILPDGKKDLHAVQSIIDELIRLQADRHWTLVNLGGGTICDLGGFAAAIYKRGVSYVNLPTTLLAMADAAIGGKTASDYQDVRNAIGAFHQPQAVWVETAFLKSLNDAGIRQGFAEIVKHAAIAGGNLWASLQAGLGTSYDDLIISSIQVKKRFVEADPDDTGVRRVLNFGHTVAHALEAVQPNLPHGVAVAIGMMAEGHLSTLKTDLPESDQIALNELVLKHCATKWKIAIDVDRIVPFLWHDKKNKQGILRLTLLKRIGTPSVDVDCTPEELIRSLETVMMHARKSN